MRLTRMTVWIALLAVVTTSIVALQWLPSELSPPRAAGARTVHYTPLSWATPLAIGVAVLLFTDWLSSQLPKRPQLFNFPGKEQLLALPAELRVEAIRRMQQCMDLVNLQLVATFAIVQWLQWQRAHGASDNTATILLMVTSPVTLIVVGVYLQRIQSAVDDAQRSYESRRNPLRG